MDPVYETFGKLLGEWSTRRWMKKVVVFAYRARPERHGRGEREGVVYQDFPFSRRRAIVLPVPFT